MRCEIGLDLGQLASITVDGAPVLLAGLDDGKLSLAQVEQGRDVASHLGFNHFKQGVPPGALKIVPPRHHTIGCQILSVLGHGLVGEARERILYKTPDGGQQLPDFIKTRQSRLSLVPEANGELTNTLALLKVKAGRCRHKHMGVGRLQQPVQGVRSLHPALDQDCKRTTRRVWIRRRNHQATTRTALHKGDSALFQDARSLPQHRAAYDVPGAQVLFRGNNRTGFQAIAPDQIGKFVGELNCSGIVGHSFRISSAVHYPRS